MASVYTNLYFNQPLVVLDTTVATPTSGSLVLYGGLTANGNAVLSHTNISGLTTLTNSTQSTDTSSGALIVTGGVAIVKNTNIGGNLVVEGSLTAGSFNTQNLNTTNLTAVNMVGTNISTGHIKADTSTITNILNTNITSGTINATNSTISNGVFTATSTGTFNVNTITTSSLLATSNISTGALYATNSTVTNGVTTAFSSGSINASTGVFNTVSTSLLSSTTISGGNMSLSGDLFVGGTITTVNITTTNLIDTNFSAGVAYVGQTLSAIGNSNTVGNIFTTGGNVGINNNSPNYQLDVDGTARFSKGITTGSLNVTGNSLLNGSVTAGSLNVTGESILQSNVTMGSNVFVSGPEFKIPVGNISARPAAPVAGHIRYNSEIQQFEGYGPGSAWGSLGGVIDIAQTTKVLASADPSTTDGNLYFYTVGDERMRVNSAGNIGIGTTAPTYKLQIVGDLGVSTGITTAAILATNISSGQLYGTNSTITNLVVTSLSTGNINITGLTAAKAYIPDATVGNLLNTNMTTTNILATNISSGQFLGSNATISNVVFTAASTGTINITGLTSASAYVTDATITNITASTLITNTIDMTPSLGDIIKEVSFSAANNQVVEANITPLAFSNSIVRSFNIIISIAILKSSGSNLYANFELKGIQKDSGDWSLNSTFVGDNTGIVFGVTNVSNKGQIQYTSSNVSNWTSTTFKFKATTTSV